VTGRPGQPVMTGRVGRKGAVRSITLAAIAAATLLPLSGASGQAPEEPVRSQRHLAVGNVSFLHTWKPLLQAGYLYQVSFRPSRATTDGFGATLVVPPRWVAHGTASLGWGPDVDGTGGSGLGATAQLGALYRFDGPLSTTRAGPVIQGAWRPRGIGPVARLEFLYGNAALSVGWMAFEGPRSNGVVLGVEVLRCILQDLGLVGSCLVP